MTVKSSCHLTSILAILFLLPLDSSWVFLKKDTWTAKPVSDSTIFSTVSPIQPRIPCQIINTIFVILGPRITVCAVVERTSDVLLIGVLI